MSRIHVSYDTSDPDAWTLERSYERQTSIGPIVVPQGFRTDLASTPRTVWRMMPRWGPWSGAAIVHDFLYRTKPPGIDRWKADRILYELMKADGVVYGDARVIYRAVREFGQLAWDSWGEAANA